ncbi:MAG TPA: APC family permease [Vicinamibacterales bacterium]|jgi:amino acid transporter
MTELRRALGRWDLTAVGVNQVIGAAIFLLPAQVAGEIGAWSPLGFVAIGLTSLAIALCFAEVGSRFDSTGGPYLFTRTAFGPFVAFEVGWIQWFVRAASQAVALSGTVLALGYYWPELTTGWPRAALVTAIAVVMAWINVRGVRESALVVNLLTVGKLLPLAIFIFFGAFHMHAPDLATLRPVTMSQAATAALLLVYVYGGYEVVPVIAGEAVDPRKHVPFAMVWTILIVMTAMTLTQVVAQGILMDVAGHSTPIADAAAVFMGSAGALLISVGSVVAITGNNAGQVLSGSRMLFALAENGDLPPLFARVHPRYRTPANAIVFTSTVALALALSGSFAQIAVVSAVARIVTYTSVSAATLRLRSPAFDGRVNPATFTTPFGPVIPIIAIAVGLAVIGGATRVQLIGGLSALAVGAVLFLIRRKPESSPQRLA